MSFSRKTDLLTGVVFGYLATLSVLPLRRLPFVGSGFQLPEFVLLIGLGWLAWHWRAVLRQRFGWLDVAILGYLIINGLSAWHSGRGACWQEFGLRVYLGLVYLVFRYWTVIHDEPDRSRVLFAATWWMGVVAALTGLAGLLLAWLGISERFAFFHENYPYFGDWWRAKGMVNHPNLLNIILLHAFFFQVAAARQSGGVSRLRQGIFFVLVPLAVLMTFSKSMLYLPMGLCLFAGLWQARRRWMWWSFALVISAFVQFGTNFILLSNTPAALEKIQREPHFSGKTAWQNDRFLLAESSYVACKRAAFILGQRQPWLGVGPGAHVLNVPDLQAEGLFPARLRPLDSHCALLGAYSETGALGLAAFLFLWMAALWMAFRLLANGLGDNVLFQATFVCLLMLALDSVSADTMNFRNLWVLLGILAGLFYHAETQRRSDG